MEFQDYNILEQRVSNYRTNHIHLFLDGQFDLLFDRMTLRDFASLVHEYVHYLQHFYTLYGLNICSGYNTLFTIYRDYFSKNQEIHIPLELPLDDDVKDFQEAYKKYYGDEDCNTCHVDAVEVNENEVKLAKHNKSSVSIGVYDFENEHIDEHGFNFGYCCIIEGMAHLVQSLINPTLYHQEIKYHAVQLICENYCERDVYQNKRLIIAACICALMFVNPGAYFFDVLDYIKKHHINDGRDLFRSFIKNYSVYYKKQWISVAEAMSDFYRRIRQSLENAIGCNLVYYSKVITNCEYCISNGHNPVIDMVYEFDLSKRGFLNEIFDLCGYPTIEDNYRIYPPIDTVTNKPYKECAALIAKEYILKRFMNKETTVCPRYEFCKKKQYTQNDPITPECSLDQWKHDEPPCLMRGSFHYYRLDDHTIIQD